MRYGIKIQLSNRNQDCHNIFIELCDYSNNYLNTVNMVFLKPELIRNVKKLIYDGINAILKKEGVSKWHFDSVEIVSMDEDEIFDYQLYIDLDHNEVCVNKVKFDLEKIKVE